VWSTDINQETMLGDQFGGMFLYPSDDANPTFTAFDASGATNFTGDGSQVMPQAGNFVSAPTRWGSGGSRWATLTLQENGDWSLVSGSMTSSMTTTTTFYDSDLVGVCGGKNVVMAWPTIEASATANPMIAVYCMTKKKKLITTFGVLASVTEGAESPLNVVAKIGNPGTKSTFSQSMEIGRNPAASGSQPALLDLTWNGHLKKSSQVIDSIVVTAVAANGTVTSTTLNSDPLDGIEWDSLNLVPGATAGRWVGFVSAFEYNPTIDDYAETYRTVTVSNNTTFTIGGAIDATDSAGDPCNISPVTAISDTRFAYLCDASKVFDGELITAESVGIANVTNHTVVKGERVTNTMSAYSNHVQQVGSWGVDGSGNPVSYWITSANDYTVVTWHLPS
jgi:predicted outer membrane repeat protein